MNDVVLHTFPIFQLSPSAPYACFVSASPVNGSDVQPFGQNSLDTLKPAVFKLGMPWGSFMLNAPNIALWRHPDIDVLPFWKQSKGKHSDVLLNWYVFSKFGTIFENSRKYFIPVIALQHRAPVAYLICWWAWIFLFSKQLEWWAMCLVASTRLSSYMVLCSTKTIAGWTQMVSCCEQPEDFFFGCEAHLSVSGSRMLCNVEMRVLFSICMWLVNSPGAWTLPSIV